MNDSINKIQQKYPHLFNNDALSISDCPEGWEKIVMGFCESLDVYKKSYRSEKIVDFRNHCLSFVAVLIYKFKNKINPYKGKMIVGYFSQNRVKTTSEKFYDRLTKLWAWIAAKQQWQKVYPPDIKISQIKEKFGTLRIYLDYADERAYGMIDLAEQLSAVTCEITGKDGQLCWRGKWRWYKTLSLDKARELGYTPAHDPS